MIETTTRTMSQQAYESQERAMFQKQLAQANKGSISERKASATKLKDTLANDLYGFIGAVYSLIHGNYGYGSYLAVNDVLKSKRMNRRAWLFIATAGIEYLCPSRYACKVWSQLPSELRAKINAELDSIIGYWESQQVEA